MRWTLNMSKPLKQQVEEQGVVLSQMDYNKYECIRNSINILKSYNIIAEDELKSVSSRFYKNLSKDILKK